MFRPNGRAIDADVAEHIRARLQAAIDGDQAELFRLQTLQRGRTKSGAIDDEVADRLQQRLKEATSPAKFFGKFDKGGDGLNAKELKKLVRSELKLSAKELTDADVSLLVEALDDDGTGTVSVAELADFVARGGATFEGASASKIDLSTATRLQQRLQEATSPAAFFRKFDKGGDGALDAKELKKLIRTDLKITKKELPDADIDALVAALDDDFSGSVSLSELSDFCERGSATFFSAPTQEEEPDDGMTKVERFFARFDLDRSGELDVVELKRLIREDLKLPAKELSDAEVCGHSGAGIGSLLDRRQSISTLPSPH